MKYSSLVTASCLFFLAACGGPQPSSLATADAAKARADFQAASSAFHQALRTDDIETFLFFVAEDVLLMPPGEAPVHGKSAVRVWYEGFLSQYRTTSLLLADQEVFLGDGWAVELGTYEWGLAPASGGTPIADRGNYMQVWKMQTDGRWRFAREVYNSSVPASAPTAD